MPLILRSAFAFPIILFTFCAHGAVAKLVLPEPSAYFRGEVAFDNTAAPVWASLTNTAVLSNVLSSETLQQFIAKTPETFAYDAEGNLTNDGRWTYVWGADNRLLSMETDTDVPTAAKRKLAFDYDPMGRRIQSEVQVWNPSTLNYELSARTKFVYDGWNLVAELNATNDTPLRTYAWGLDTFAAVCCMVTAQLVPRVIARIHVAQSSRQ